MSRKILSSLIVNGGQGSGNFSPGQGRGVGKPGSGSGKGIYSKSHNVKAQKERLSGISRELDNTVEDLERAYKSATEYSADSGYDDEYDEYDEYDDYGSDDEYDEDDSGYEDLESLVEDMKSLKEDFYKKSQTEEGFSSDEEMNILDSLSKKVDKISSEYPDEIDTGEAFANVYEKLSSLKDKIEKAKEELNSIQSKLTINGGPGSGNYAPGQGRGVGKPNSGSGHGSSKSSSRKTGFSSRTDYHAPLGYNKAFSDKDSAAKFEQEFDGMMRIGVSLKEIAEGRSYDEAKETKSMRESEGLVKEIGKAIKDTSSTTSTYMSRSLSGSLLEGSRRVSDLYKKRAKLLEQNKDLDSNDKAIDRNIKTLSNQKDKYSKSIYLPEDEKKLKVKIYEESISMLEDIKKMK